MQSQKLAIWIAVALGVCLIAVIITFAVLGGGSSGTGTGY